ncbi:hypothetical protein ACFV4N_42950 [Actinosynnema sp. NPDC059797]
MPTMRRVAATLVAIFAAAITTATPAHASIWYWSGDYDSEAACEYQLEQHIQQELEIGQPFIWRSCRYYNYTQLPSGWNSGWYYQFNIGE